MVRWRAAILAAGFLSIHSWACNGQFDFDTGTTGVEDGAVISDALEEPQTETRPSSLGIACGTSTCQSPGCCKTATDLYCVDGSDTGTCAGLLLQCDDGRDCSPGQRCCAETSGDLVTHVHCEAEDHCVFDNYIILCDPNEPSACTQCVALPLATLPPGYHQCLDPL